VKPLSQLGVGPCQEKQLHRERLASHRTVRYYFVIAVRRAKKQNPQRDVLASNAGNLGGAVGVDGGLPRTFKQLTAKEYKDATITRVEGDGIVD